MNPDLGFVAFVKAKSGQSPLALLNEYFAGLQMVCDFNLTETTCSSVAAVTVPIFNYRLQVKADNGKSWVRVKKNILLK